MKKFNFLGLILFLFVGQITFAKPILIHEANMKCDITYTQDSGKRLGSLTIQIFGETRYTGNSVALTTVVAQLAQCKGVLDNAAHSVNMIGHEKGIPNVSEFVWFDSEGKIEDGTLIQNDGP